MGRQKPKLSSRGKKGKTHDGSQDDEGVKSASSTRADKNGHGHRGKALKKGRTGQCKESIYDDDSFRRTLQGDGTKTIKEMHSDGNCLFRSLSDQLFQDYGNRHEQIRKEICDYLEANEEHFSVFLTLDDETSLDCDVCSFDEYVSRMRNDGEWGGDVELVCAARLYRRGITIFSTVGAYNIESGLRHNDGHELQLSFHENNHYNSVYDDKIQYSFLSETNTFLRTEIGNKKEFDLERAEKLVECKGQGQLPVSKDSDNYCQRRNDLCSCGSGLRYKKCCLAREKRRLRLVKFQSSHDGVEEECDDSARRDTEVELNGTFRVLNI